MQLNLTDTQVGALKTVIDSYYSDLREEIYHTDDYDARQALKALEHELELLREQLEPGWIERTGAGRDDQPPASPVDSGQGAPTP